MVWSVRNYLFNSKKFGWILYAGNSGSVIGLTDEMFGQVDNLKRGDFSTLEENSLALLKEYGVIIDMTDDDLLNIMAAKSIKARCSNYLFGLSICPSNSCNFNCTYCFEAKGFRNPEKNDSSVFEVMNRRTIKNILNYVKTTNSRRVDITIFGGEPLLSIESIINFHNEIKQMHLETHYDIITNGYLLSSENIEILDSLPVETYQVTIDGPAEMHNKKRPHLEDEDSYSQIMANLNSFASYFKNRENKPAMHIRVNIDRLNKDVFHTLYYEIKENFPSNFIPYSAFVFDESGENKNVLLPHEQANFILDNFHNHNIFEYQHFEKKFKIGHCMADAVNSIVVDSKGDVYKCLNDIGIDDKMLFSMDKCENYNDLLEASYLVKSSPFLDEDCRKCFLFYSCFGGCPRKRLCGKKECLPLKHNPDALLEIYFEKLSTLNKGVNSC